MAPRNQPKSIRFFDLLLNYSREPDQDKRDALEKDIWAEFGARHSVLVLDMSGFSKLAQRHGIVHYLAMVRRMQSEKANPKAPKTLDPDIKALQDDLGQKLGAKVQIQHSAKGKGKLVLSYNSLDELDGILSHIK